MNLLDYVLLLVLVYVAARGARLGGLSQVASYGAAALGLLAGALFAPDLAGLIADGPGVSLALLTLTFLLASLFIAQSIGVAIGMRLRAAVADAGVGGLDALAGIGVAIAGLIVTVWLLAAPLSRGPSVAVAEQVRESRFISAISQALPAPPDLLARVGTYLDRQGFPQVFSGVEDAVTAPPVGTPQGAAVAAATEAGRAGVVQVEATGCGGISFGSGFVVSPGFVVTNAHVVAGGSQTVARAGDGSHPASVVLFDPDLDLAVLQVGDLEAPALSWASQPALRGAAGATLGFSGGAREMVAKPAAVRSRVRAIGRDIYGRETVTREVLILADGVERGDSGGPFVTGAGEVGGVVFAAAVSEPNTGYALSAESVRDRIAGAIAEPAQVGTGACRF